MKRLFLAAALAAMLVAVTAASARAPAVPKLKIEGATAVEGQAHRMLFRITLSKRAAKTVSGRFYTQDGTAKAGSDYVAKSGRFKIAKGKSRTRIVVSVIDDEIPEPNEHFFLIVTGVKNASVGRSFGQGNIIDDDVAP